ncbi:MAG: glycosyltransferase family 4 protein [Williamsia sp.]|nr:glycosyltransferase family 4 protein [Williamsia sp.]
MNILITAPSLNESENVSGISTIVRTIINSNRSSVKFLHFRIGNKDGEPKGFKWAVSQVALLPRMARFIRRQRINAVHLNTDFTKTSLLRDFVIFSFLKNVMHKPVLLHIHGGHMLMKPPAKGSLFKWVIDRMLKHSDKNVVLSAVEQEQLRKAYGAESEALPNAVETKELKPLSKNFTAGIKFIFLGRIVRSKGVYQIAEAFKQLNAYHDRCSFTVYGSGPELAPLLQELEAIPTLRFEYKGIARGEEKWKALEQANVFLLPSLYGEGLPIAMLEAMQAGCVPVVSDDASITTVVNNGVNGFVIKKGDQGALVETMKNILTQRSGLEQLSQAAKSTIIEHYGISQYMRNLASYYSTFVN